MYLWFCETKNNAKIKFFENLMAVRSKISQIQHFWDSIIENTRFWIYQSFRDKNMPQFWSKSLPGRSLTLFRGMRSKKSKSVLSDTPPCATNKSLSTTVASGSHAKMSSSSRMTADAESLYFVCSSLINPYLMKQTSHSQFF